MHGVNFHGLAWGQGFGSGVICASAVASLDCADIAIGGVEALYQFIPLGNSLVSIWEAGLPFEFVGNVITEPCNQVPLGRFEIGDPRSGNQHLKALDVLVHASCLL